MSKESLGQYSFPTAIVKYHGPTNYRGSRYIATIKRGNGPEDTFRASEPFHGDHGMGGIDGAVELAARKAFTKIGMEGEPRTLILGSIDADSYAVVFVPNWAISSC